ncbi:hypothetical protein SLS64_007920 [Diaporthe eres]|uniref:Kinesin light chain n=1 Tax=Diaporthe eres TaxID=83184 RepID=A0ABR1PFD1_DIAER
MNKFGSDKDNHYISVVEELKKMKEKSEDLMRQRRAASHAKGFAPRDGILEKIKSHFDHSSKVVLVGGCGTGKTHVAVEYAGGFLNENPEAMIHFVNGSNSAEFEQSYHLINDKLKLKTGKRGNVMKVVCDYLRQGESGNWLMIIDGLDHDNPVNEMNKQTATAKGFALDSLKSVLEYIPDGHTYGGQVLITTRSKHVATRVINHKYIVELPKSLSKDDALQLLLSGSKSKDTSSTTYQSKIVEALQGSAGALALVRAYKETSGSEFSWKDSWSVIQNSFKDSDGLSAQTNEQIRCMLGIWKPLYTHLRSKHNEAADLLHTLCRLDVQSIPVFLIDSRYDDKSERDKHMKALRKHDMLEISVNRRNARVTPMIRLLANSMISNNLEDSNFHDGAALELVCDAFPPPEVEDNIKCRALKPSALAALQLGLQSPKACEQTAHLLLKLGAFERRVGNEDNAVNLLEKCLESCKGGEQSQDRKRLEKEAKKLLDNTRKDRLRAARRQSRDKDGSQSASHLEESPHTKAMIISPKSKADEVRSMSHAVLDAHRRADCLADNVKRHQQILDWFKAKYGAKHQGTVRQQFNLALALDANGEHTEAVKMYFEAIKAMESIEGRGSPSPELLRVQASLARNYGEQGRFKEAEATLAKVLEDQTEILGRDHPETLVTRLNMALLAQDLRPGDLETPATELQSVLSTQTRLLGDAHPATLRTASNLAQNYGLRGRIMDAEPLFELSLEGQIKSLGEKHPDTMRTLAMRKELEDATEVC